ncbi:hypothetical protein ElyMa_007008300 [Elysia marginata]|uniref:Tc1-like transposase DDE domain-containing protein n=1 Tax=Elysia marginata TaxID=1093978 RepID=A0AAV4JR80_9GAST|nr:hypothetical protein ElyMa_007008300 [Elysia marginata]
MTMNNDNGDNHGDNRDDDVDDDDDDDRDDDDDGDDNDDDAVVLIMMVVMILMVVMDTKDLVLLDILAQGQCINAAQYCSTIDSLREGVLCNNATLHSANLTQQWLQHYGWEIFLILPTW